MFDIEDGDAYYCPELVTYFYTQIDTNTIVYDHQTFIVHFESGDIVVNVYSLEMSHTSPVIHDMMTHYLSLSI